MGAPPEATPASELSLLDPDGAFLVRLGEDHAALARLAGGLAASPTPRDVLLGQIEVLAHRLAGAAGTFGHAAVGAAAFDLEHCIIAARRGSGSADAAAVERCIAGLLAALGRSIGSASTAKERQD